MTSLHDIFAAAKLDFEPLDGRPLVPQAFDIKLRVVPVAWEIKPGEPTVVKFAIQLNDTATIHGDRLAHYYWDEELTLPLEQVHIFPSGGKDLNIPRQQ